MNTMNKYLAFVLNMFSQINNINNTVNTILNNESDYLACFSCGLSSCPAPFNESNQAAYHVYCLPGYNYCSTFRRLNFNCEVAEYYRMCTTDKYVNASNNVTFIDFLPLTDGVNVNITYFNSYFWVQSCNTSFCNIVDISPSANLASFCQSLIFYIFQVLFVWFLSHLNY